MEDSTFFVALLKACAKKKDICEGTRLHADILKQGLLEKSPYLGSSLISMYTKCGMLSKAQQVFDELPIRDIVCWNALITGYAQHGQGHKAISCFDQMQSDDGISPNEVTFICILKACGSTRSIDIGKQIHDKILSMGLLEKYVMLGTALVDMYAKCDMLTKAEYVFKALGLRDIVTWSALIAGYAQQGQSYEALRCFKEMQSEGLSPNTVTFICILKACGINEGKQIHEEIVSRGLLLGENIVLTNALLDMYVRCGYLSNAYEVLEQLPCRNVVSWNTLIGGYAKYGLCEDVINCLGYMQNEGISPNAVTFIGILKACCNIGALHMGENMHNQIARMGLLRKDIVLGTTLVDMYAKCGALAKSQQVLEELPNRDVVSWSALIAGYAEEGQVHKALCCLECMRNEGFTPNEVTFLCILSACGHSGLMDKAQILFQNMEKECGMIPSSEHHISMIVVYGNAGHFDNAMSVIKVMPSSEYGEIWLILLGACRKWGNVKLGKLAFDEITHLDNSLSTAYVVMANIYAAAGMHEDAANIEKMRVENVAWKKSTWVDAMRNLNSSSVWDANAWKIKKHV